MINAVKRENRLPREVWAASVSLKGLWPVDTIEKRMKDVLERMESVYAFDPDVIVLTETVNTSWVREQKTLEECEKLIAEAPERKGRKKKTAKKKAAPKKKAAAKKKSAKKKTAKKKTVKKKSAKKKATTKKK